MEREGGEGVNKAAGRGTVGAGRERKWREDVVWVLPSQSPAASARSQIGPPGTGHNRHHNPPAVVDMPQGKSQTL